MRGAETCSDFQAVRIACDHDEAGGGVELSSEHDTEANWPPANNCYAAPRFDAPALGSRKKSDIQIKHADGETHQHPTLEAGRENIAAHHLRRFGGTADQMV